MIIEIIMYLHLHEIYIIRSLVFKLNIESTHYANVRFTKIIHINMTYTVIED